MRNISPTKGRGTYSLSQTYSGEKFYFGEVLNFEMMSYKLPTWIIFAIFLPSFTDLQHV